MFPCALPKPIEFHPNDVDDGVCCELVKFIVIKLFVMFEVDCMPIGICCPIIGLLGSNWSTGIYNGGTPLSFVKLMSFESGRPHPKTFRASCVRPVPLVPPDLSVSLLGGSSPRSTSFFPEVLLPDDEVFPPAWDTNDDG